MPEETYYECIKSFEVDELDENGYPEDNPKSITINKGDKYFISARDPYLIVGIGRVENSYIDLITADGLKTAMNEYFKKIGDSDDTRI